MGEIENFKKFLGPIAKQYNEAQLLQLRREMREAADLLLDIYIWRKAKGKGGDILTESTERHKMSP